MWVDARVSTVAQYFQQGLVPGQPGVVARVDTAFPITLAAFLRVGAIDLPGAADSVSAEVSAWGSAGPRNGTNADADVTAAWAQYKKGIVRVKLGRQVTLPGSSRFVRFDGAAVGVSLGSLDLDGYFGWVALPRWNLGRGATLLGAIDRDTIKDPLLMEAQNRAGQVTAGVRIGLRLPLQTRAALAFHEQHDLTGPAFRVLSADLASQPLKWLGAGARLSFDLQALAVSEARVWFDITALPLVPVALDYSFQQPSLLLPQTSVLAAFGGASWHELGAETTVRALPSLKVTARGAAQLFPGDQTGGRGTLRAVWTPDLDGRWMLLGEVQRVLVPPSGYSQLRAGARWRAAQTVTASIDGAVFFYDVPIHGVPLSVTGIGSVEWAAKPWLRALLSATVMRTPYAAFEAQGLARVIFELDPVSSGGRQ